MVQFGNRPLLKKKKKINITSPQGLDVKFYHQGLQIRNYGMSATCKQSVKRLLKHTAAHCGVNCPSLLLTHGCHSHLTRGKLRAAPVRLPIP